VLSGWLIALAAVVVILQPLGRREDGRVWSEASCAPAPFYANISSRWVDQYSLCHVYMVCFRPAADASPESTLEYTSAGESNLPYVCSNRLIHTRDTYSWAYTSRVRSADVCITPLKSAPFTWKLNTACFVYFSINARVLQQNFI
jgi:hypothetical protein